MTLFSSFLIVGLFLIASSAQLEQSTLEIPTALDDLKVFAPHPKQPGRRIPVPTLYYEKYSKQTFIGTHNSIAVRTAENNWSLSGNQYFNVSTQLESGVRLLQAQAHRDPDGLGGVRLCHYNCALMDGGSLESFLRTVVEFLETHPFEVVTLLFVNTGVPLRAFAQAYYDTQADLLSFIPPRPSWQGSMGVEDWPTIAEMVSANKRLVTFLSGGANPFRVPFLLAEFNHIFETNFGIEAPDQYTCTPSRPRWPFVPDRLSLVNHFLYAKFLGFNVHGLTLFQGYPNASYANTTNGAGFTTGQLGEHAARCRSLYSRRPNFLLVDFFNEGDVFDVEYGMNDN